MDSGSQQSQLDTRLRQYQALCEVAESISSHRDLTSLLTDLKERLHLVVRFGAVHIVLRDEKRNLMLRHILVSPGQLREQPITEIAMEEAPSGWVWQTQEPMLITDIAAYERRYPQVIAELREHGIKAAYILPLTSQGRRLGAIVFITRRESAWSEDDQKFLQQVAKLVAVAVDSTINSENARAADMELKRRLEHLGLMLKITTAVVSQLDLQELLQVICSTIREAMGSDIVDVSLFDQEIGQLRAYVTHFPSDHPLGEKGALIPLEGGPSGLAFTSGQPVFIDKPDFERFHSNLSRQVFEEGYRSGGTIPLIAQGRKLGVLSVISRLDDAFSDDDKELLVQIANQVAIAIDNALNFERARKAERQAIRQTERRQLLLEINNAVVSNLDLPALLASISESLRRVLPHDFAGMALYDAEAGQLRVHALDHAKNQEIFGATEMIPLNGTGAGKAFTSRKPILLGNIDPTKSPLGAVRHVVDAGLKSSCHVPLISHDRALGTLDVMSFQEGAFSQEDAELLTQIASQIAIAVENALNFERARQAERQAGEERDRSELLLDINNAVISHLDLNELVKTISASLLEILPHDTAGIALYDAEHDHLREYANIAYPGYDAFPLGEVFPLVGTPAGQVFTSGQPLLLRRTDTERFPSDHVPLPDENIVTSACLVPLISHGRKLGILGVGSGREEAFTEADLERLSQIAGQVAIAVENALNFERARKAEQQAKQKADHLGLLLEINNAIVSQLSLRELVRVTSIRLREVLKHDITGISLYNPEINQFRAYMFDMSDKLPMIEKGMTMPLEGSIGGMAFTSGQPIFMNRVDARVSYSEFDKRLLEAGIRSGGIVPLIVNDRKLGVLAVGSFREDAFSKADQELLCHIANQIALAVENAVAYREIETLKNKLASEKLYLEAEIRTEHNFEELIGVSQIFKRILKQVETVAPTDSAVLIRGETGTGKELLARAIHNLSTRCERTLVKLNCAAIPTGLLESELFGHEKGAFTGAITQRIGRFELANKGTLFLDEVGDIPLELQPKLLRVLQEQEFERLGSTRTQRVDVRLVAATNCDLEEMVADKKYRSDLYYRLNVFPVTIPPLRERAEDIPVLARFFTQKYARRMKKRIEAIPAEAMAALTSYHWPGNVRELEHFIERAVILTQGSDLEVSLSELKASAPAVTHANISTLEEAEREHILRALEESNWVIGGPNGAAARLGMKRTTLQSRIQKLGFTRGKT